MGDPDSMEEKVVMTPVRKTENSTTLIVERKAVSAVPGERTHVAGGEHTGIVINKENVCENGVRAPCHASLEFRVYLVSAGGGAGGGAGAGAGHSREARALRFWFGSAVPPAERAHAAQDFFRELVSPQEFPKDYVGFIKKIMKLMQHKYSELKTLEIELRQEGCGPPPAAYIEETPVISEQRVLELIENAYPNPLTVEDFATANKWSQSEVKDALQALEEKGLTRAMAGGMYVRQHSLDTQVVKQMPSLGAAHQPTIAVVTALYCEKQAVDAMLDHTETYVRYNTGSVGESNVYTLGSIGAHRVVTTKLPAVGRSREAVTAAGGATTRLLGIFQKVEFVVLVGVGGGVAHYADHARHVRLGDVVVSAGAGGTPTPAPQDSYVYVYCERAERNEQGGWDFEVKPYRPANLLLQDLARRLADQGAWDRYIAEGVKRLRDVPGRWEPPAGDDRLCVELGDGAYIEVAHPTPPQDSTDGPAAGLGGRRVWLAPVCGGRAACGEARAAVALHTRAQAFDCELAAVLDSVVGNRKDCFINIRGIADYRDGTRGKAWHGAAAAAAAAVMRAIVASMDPPRD